MVILKPTIVAVVLHGVHKKKCMDADVSYGRFCVLLSCHVNAAVFKFLVI